MTYMANHLKTIDIVPAAGLGYTGNLRKLEELVNSTPERVCVPSTRVGSNPTFSTSDNLAMIISKIAFCSVKDHCSIFKNHASGFRTSGLNNLSVKDDKLFRTSELI